MENGSTGLIEKELIEECIKGDLHNFRKVVEKSTPFVFSVAFRMLGDDEEAKDVVQDTMVTIWEKMNRIKSSDSYKTWLYRITINKCHDLLRKNKHKNEFRYDDEAWGIIANHITEEKVSELENSDNARIINILTDKLGPRQKSVFILAEIEQLPYDEIAKITGMNKSSVKSNLYYARKNIEAIIRKNLLK